MVGAGWDLNLHCICSQIWCWRSKCFSLMLRDAACWLSQAKTKMWWSACDVDSGALSEINKKGNLWGKITSRKGSWPTVRTCRSRNGNKRAITCNININICQKMPKTWTFERWKRVYSRWFCRKHQFGSTCLTLSFDFRCFLKERWAGWWVWCISSRLPTDGSSMINWKHTV